MAQLLVIVDGKEYPCRPTMGAMLRFKRETGREVTDINGSLEDLTTYLWCCVCSASRREGKEFGMSLMDFADHMDPEDLQQWARLTSKENTPGAADATGDEKKTSA